MANVLNGPRLSLGTPFPTTLVLLLGAGAVAADETAPHLTLLGIPSATVAPHGSGFVSLQFTNQRQGPGTDSDASLSFGAGFGDAERTLGVQLTAEVTSTTDDPGDSGYFDVKLSRRISSGQTPAYLGLGYAGSPVGAMHPGLTRRWT